MKILVGISGGVDSSVTALKLKEAGHEPIGVMMQIYKGESKCDALNSCYGISKEKEISDAKAVCERVGMDFHLIDLSAEFQNLVFSEFQEAYASGKTPNPCVLCNPRVKFGALPKIAKQMGIEFEKFATGHYAQVEQKGDRYIIRRGKNPKKDQSYFLYGLSQEQLANILFPLGGLTKEEVRDFALKKGLITHDKKDSQDFYKGDYGDILNIQGQEGEIVLADGTVLGHHEGIHNFTTGQRKGIGVAYSEPLYVLELEKETNRVIVGPKCETFSHSLIAKSPNWVAFSEAPKGLECFAKHRSTQDLQKCYIETIDNDNIKVTFETPQSSIATGQSVVFYEEDILLGGAEIIRSNFK